MTRRAPRRRGSLMCNAGHAADPGRPPERCDHLMHFVGAASGALAAPLLPIVKSIVVAHGAFNGVGTIVEVPNQPGDGEDIFRDDFIFAQGTLHLVTTNVGFAFDVIPQSCRFTASVQQTGEIARRHRAVHGRVRQRCGRRGRARDRGSCSGRELRPVRADPARSGPDQLDGHLVLLSASNRTTGAYGGADGDLRPCRQPTQASGARVRPWQHPRLEAPVSSCAPPPWVEAAVVVAGSRGGGRISSRRR